jgi:hypothetical protein
MQSFHDTPTSSSSGSLSGNSSQGGLALAGEAPAAAAAAADGHGSGQHPAVGRAHTAPEHAQAAGLLGQPVFDPELSPRPSSSNPQRSPFVSQLLYHSHHLAGPHEKQQKQKPPLPPVRGSAAANGSSGSSSSSRSLILTSGGSGPRAAAADAEAEAALADALASLGTASPPSSSGAGAGGQPRPQSQRQLLPSSSSKNRRLYAALPFSARNAPLLRVIPRYCEQRPLACTDGCRCLPLPHAPAVAASSQLCIHTWCQHALANPSPAHLPALPNSIIAPLPSPLATPCRWRGGAQQRRAHPAGA